MNDLEPAERHLIREAEGFAELGDFTHAWLLIDELPPSQRAHPMALRVRLIAATGLKKWTHGEDIAELFALSHVAAEREAAGRFYLARIRALVAEGTPWLACALVEQMAGGWPEGRMEIVNDRALFDALFPEAR